VGRGAAPLPSNFGHSGLAASCLLIFDYLPPLQKIAMKNGVGDYDGVCA